MAREERQQRRVRRERFRPGRRRAERMKRERGKKKGWVAYMLWGLSLHRFYFERYVSVVGMMLASWMCGIGMVICAELVSIINSPLYKEAYSLAQSTARQAHSWGIKGVSEWIRGVIRDWEEGVTFSLWFFGIIILCYVVLWLWDAVKIWKWLGDYNSEVERINDEIAAEKEAKRIKSEVKYTEGER